jgi:hypothetical protein
VGCGARVCETNQLLDSVRGTPGINSEELRSYVTSTARCWRMPARNDLVELSSSAFAPIPLRHPCQGEDLPRPLEWPPVQAEVVPLALIDDDPTSLGAEDSPARPSAAGLWQAYEIPLWHTLSDAL